MSDPLLVLVRALHIGSALLLGGLLFFRQFCLQWPSDEPAGVLFERRLFRWLIGAWLVQFVSGAAWLWIAAAGMSGVPLPKALDPAMLQIVLEQTQFGRLWLIRGTVMIVLGAALWLLAVSRASLRSSVAGVAFALSGLLVVSLAWAGHGDANPSALHLGADILHLAVASVWPTGLLPLLLFLRASHDDAAHNAGRAVATLNRFSQIALAMIILLFLTGLTNAWFLIPSWEALGTSLYGRLLLFKGALFFAMTGFGARNRFVFLPEVRLVTTSATAFLRLRRTVLIESVLGLSVLFIVGWMGATPPPEPGP